MRGRPRAGDQRRHELLALLHRLAGPGAMLVETGEAPDGGQRPGLAVLTRNGVDTTVATVDRDLLAKALAQGWLTASSDGHRMVVTRSGRELLRRAKVGEIERATIAHPATRNEERDPARRNAMECPLGWLAGRRDGSGKPFLEPEEVAAGERLRADLTFAGLGPRVTMSWSGMPSDRSGAKAAGLGGDMTDSVLAARQRVAKALRKVGPELSGLLIDVCGHYRGLADIAASEGWPQRAARLILQKALRILARHYGLLPDVPVEETIAARLRHWGGDGYRPKLTSATTPADHEP